MHQTGINATSFVAVWEKLRLAMHDGVSFDLPRCQQVPADMMDRVADKLPAVGNMVKTAMLVMKGSTVHISGASEWLERFTVYAGRV